MFRRVTAFMNKPSLILWLLVAGKLHKYKIQQDSNGDDGSSIRALRIVLLPSMKIKLSNLVTAGGLLLEEDNTKTNLKKYTS